MGINASSDRGRMDCGAAYVVGKLAAAQGVVVVTRPMAVAPPATKPTVVRCAVSCNH